MWKQSWDEGHADMVSKPGQHQFLLSFFHLEINTWKIDHKPQNWKLETDIFPSYHFGVSTVSESSKNPDVDFC